MTTLEFLRQFRIGEYAIFDLSLSFLGMWLLSSSLSKLFRKVHLDIPKINWVYLTLPIGILAHIMVGRITPMVKNLVDPQGYYILKLVIVASLALGARNIKRIKKN